MTHATSTTLVETVTLKYVVISSSTVLISLMKDWLSWAPDEILMLLSQRHNVGLTHVLPLDDTFFDKNMSTVILEGTIDYLVVTGNVNEPLFSKP